MAAYEGEVLNEKPQQVSGAVVPTAVDFEAEYKAKADKLKEDYDKKVKELTTSTLKVGPETYEIPSALTSPVGLLAGGALLAGGGYLAGKAIYNKTASALDGIKNRMINKGPDLSAPTPTAQQPVTEKPKSTFAQQFETTYGVPLSKAEELTGGPITNPRDAAIVGGALKNQSGISVTSPYQITSPPPIPFELDDYAKSGMVTGQQPKAPVAPTDPFAPRPNPYINPSVDNPYMTPSVEASVQTGNTAQAVQTVIAQELDKTTGVAPTTTIKTPVEPTTFRADLGPGDNWLFNTAGPEKRKAILKEFNEGKPAGSFDEAQRLWAKYVESRKETFAGPEMTKEVRKERGIPPRENFGKLGKVAKVGGVAGLALTAAQMAQAAQNRKYGEAAFMGADIATDFIPGVAQLKQGLSPTEAGAPGVSQQRFETSALLGSPYAQTEWAKNQRLKEKAGAGRGIAPPSAYMR